jgi:hypothetical protein
VVIGNYLVGTGRRYFVNDDIQRLIGPEGPSGVVVANNEKSPSQLKDVYRDIKFDFGFYPLLFFVAGALLLIFNPEKGWKFELPFCNLIIAWRGWIGCFLFFLAFVLSKRRKYRLCWGLKKDKNKQIKQVYVQFPKEMRPYIPAIASSMYGCKSFEEAKNTLKSLCKRYEGVWFESEKSNNFEGGEELKDGRWWWYKDDGQEGWFQYLACTDSSETSIQPQGTT